MFNRSGHVGIADVTAYRMSQDLQDSYGRIFSTVDALAAVEFDVAVAMN